MRNGVKLLQAWLMLMVLTGLVGIAAAVTGGRPGQTALLAVGGLTCIKVRMVLTTYLRLPAGTAMSALLTLVAVTILIVIGSFVLFPTFGPA